MAYTQNQNIRYDDKQVWDLICSGFTCGVFQCESKLVQQWLKRIKPRNIWDLSAVIAIVRPGALKSGFADEFVALRNNEKEYEAIDGGEIDKIFQAAGGILLYQENLMSLGSKVAWPHLEENERLIKVDALRKAVGKKNQQKILEIGREFVEGCKLNKVNEETANNLFEVIKNCGRYLFNLSHSMAYAFIAYRTAYYKCHYPLEFYSTYLSYTRSDQKTNKWQEIEILANDARIFGIEILSPNINTKNRHFKIEDNKIRYGLQHIKYLGTKDVDVINNIPLIKDWRQVILVCCTDVFNGKIKTNAAEALIKTNAFSDVGIDRFILLELVNITNQLSNKELEWVIEKLPEYESYEDYPKLIEACIEECATKNRKPKLTSMLKLLNLEAKTKFTTIEQNEKFYLGLPLSSYSGLNYFDDRVDTCQECYGFFEKGDKKQIVVVLDDIRITTTKKGKNPGQKMALITVYDDTGKLESLPVFPELFLAVEDILIYRNALKLDLYYSGNGWIIQDMREMSNSIATKTYS